MLSEALAGRLAAVKLVILDADGVLTDGTVMVDGDGREWLRFDIQDGYGIVQAKRAGLEFAIISGRDAGAVRARAHQLGITELHLGSRDKPLALQRILEHFSVQPDQVAYMGDDLNDLPMIGRVGVLCAVANARPEVKEAADLVTSASGGRGAVREFLEHIQRVREPHA